MVERNIAPKHIIMPDKDPDHIAMAAYYLSRVDYKDARAFVQHSLPSSHWSANSKHVIRIIASDAQNVRELALHANGSSTMTLCTMEDTVPEVRVATSTDFSVVMSIIRAQVTPSEVTVSLTEAPESEPESEPAKKGK